MIAVTVLGGRPNILMYVIDDLGWGDLSLSGLAQDRTQGGHSTFRTPHIDRLASEGVVLDRYYVNQLCSPTRTSLLSARYAYHLGLGGGVITDGHPETLRLNESTIANHLKELGYKTHAVGKWDAGYTIPHETPVGRGFDTFVGYYNADEDYYTHECGGAGAHPPCSGLDLHDDSVNSAGELVLRPLYDRTTYSTTLYTSAVVNTIARHDRSLGPFFIYAAYQAVHGPLEAPERYQHMCEAEHEPARHVFCAMVLALDEGIGNISATLQMHGYANETIVAFTTDNGGQNAVGGNNWPLRGNKATVFEGGVRGTGFVWGTALHAGAGGRRLWRGMMHNVDWLPTLVAAAGGQPPEGKDGVSVWEALVTDGVSPRSEMLLQLTGPHSPRPSDVDMAGVNYQLSAAYMRGPWKVVWMQPEAPCPEAANISQQISTCGRRATGWVQMVGDHRSYVKPTEAQTCWQSKPCLFNIEDDPLEQNDIGARYPDKLAELLDALAKYNASQIPNQAFPFDESACPRPPANAWMPWRNTSFASAGGDDASIVFGQHHREGWRGDALDSEMEPQCRDRWLEPFSATSIWNTAIGSLAKFKPAMLFAPGDYRGDPANFHNDHDFLVRGGPDDPLTDWINQGDWNTRTGEECVVQKHSHGGEPCSSGTQQIDGCVAKIRFPRTWTSATDCDASGHNCSSTADQKGNNAMALLLADNTTLVQMQPAYRCGHYPAPLLARWGNATDGGPQRFDNVTSILAEGTYGAHGGSGLSSIGGTIRLGELLPGSPPIAHALKIELANWWYFGQAQLQPVTADNGGRVQYVWPATGSNADFVNGSAGANYLGTDPFVVPGGLLAIPYTIAASVTTTTTIGGRIKQAMVDYGAYLVDGAGHGDSKDPFHHNLAAICMDALVNDEMRAHYGYSMAHPAGVRRPGLDPTQTHAQDALYNDLLRIFRALHSVTNNGPHSIGGGGRPRKPTKGPICN